MSRAEEEEMNRMRESTLGVYIISVWLLTSEE
jgi:hypothetical protein